MSSLEEGDTLPTSLQVEALTSLDVQIGDQPEKKKKIAEELRVKLKNYESMILSLQRLLVWENLTNSSIFIAIIHLLFLYIASRCNHLIGFASSVSLLFVWVDVWKEKIWPEVRAHAPSPDSEWGELNPRLLSLHEMCEYLAHMTVSLQNFWYSALTLRRKEPLKFVTQACGICLLTALIGRVIPGVVLFYFIFAALVFWPCIWHHRLHDKALVAIQPYFSGLQYTFKQHPRESYQVVDGKRKRVLSELSTPDEDFISEFVPKQDTTAVVLAKALTEGSELSEADEGLLAQKLPSFSKVGQLPKVDSFLDQAALSVKLPTPDEIINSSSDEEEDSQIGFVPTGNNKSVIKTSSSNQLLTPEGSQVLNDIIKEVSTNSFGGFVAGLASAQSIIGQQGGMEVRQRRSESSTPSSEFEVLDSAMLD